jgi:hypothetical protein
VFFRFEETRFFFPAIFSFHNNLDWALAGIGHDFYMSFEVDSTIYPDHVRVNATGNCSLPQIVEFIDVVNDIAVEAGRNRVLIDIRSVDGSPSGADLFFAGERIAQVFGSRIKAVVVNRPERITRLGELTAVNRGARFFVTGEESEALDWLLTN